jgi:3-hydroxyacyl-CoA dehydrogenase/enoyl-CoA hydratase/3-hydroxybutyryl-CoA epimerase
MNSYLTVTVADGIATILLNDVDASVNTVSPDWLAAMRAAFEDLKVSEAVTGIIVTSAKRDFMAGADLKFILKHAGAMTPTDAFAFSQTATTMHRLIETCGKPVVAALNGFALGGGYELALACTCRILVDRPGAVVGLPEVNVGLLPGSGGTQRLPRMIGVNTALDVLLEGRSYAAADALKLGLVDAVVAPDALLDAAKAWLKTAPDPVRAWDRKGFALPESDGLLKQSTAGKMASRTGKLLAKYGDNYPAPISILTSVFEGVQGPFDTGLRIESRHFARLLTSPVSRNIIRTNFVNKGTAGTRTARPEGLETFQVSRLAILGAGMMGAGIAHAAAKVGIDVVLLDTTQEAAQKGKAYSERIVERAVDQGRMMRESADALLARIKPTIDYQDLTGVQIVVEAVFEDLAIKADVTRKATAVLPSDAIFASNTSTLPITQLAQAFPRPENFIGLHFFSPVDRMELVEVIRGKGTGDACVARSLDFIAQIRKTPIVVNDSRGFYTSRVFQTFIHEGMELLREGVAPALIENAAKLAGMPVGPLAVTDEVTLELPMKIVREAEAQDPGFHRPGSMTVMEKMVDQLGRPGRRGGGGFYEYPTEGRKRLWQDLGEHFPLAKEQPSLDSVKKRILYIQALETARCLEEGVLTDAADGDVGSILAWGFPAWTGGTLSLIDTVGVANFVAECEDFSEKHGPRFTPTASLRDMASKGTSFWAEA